MSLIGSARKLAEFLSGADVLAVSFAVAGRVGASDPISVMARVTMGSVVQGVVGAAVLVGPKGDCGVMTTLIASEGGGGGGNVLEMLLLS